MSKALVVDTGRSLQSSTFAVKSLSPVFGLFRAKMPAPVCGTNRRRWLPETKPLQSTRQPTWPQYLGYSIIMFSGVFPVSLFKHGLNITCMCRNRLSGILPWQDVLLLRHCALQAFLSNANRMTQNSVPTCQPKAGPTLPGLLPGKIFQAPPKSIARNIKQDGDTGYGRNSMAMGQNPVPAVDIPIPTKIGSKMGGAPTPKWYHWF